MREAKNEQNFGRVAELYHVTTARMRMRMRNVRNAMSVFTGNVLSIPGGKILDKNCESLHWWQTFRWPSDVYIRSGLNHQRKLF